MPKATDRLPGPSQGPVCPACRFWWPTEAASATWLDHAEHDVHHFEWEATRRGVPPSEGLAAYRTLLPLLRAAHGERMKRLNRQLTDLELELAGALYDLNVERGLSGDLRAELDAVLEGRHMTP